MFNKFNLTDNLTRSGAFAPFAKVARLAADILALGYHPDEPIVGWEASDPETCNVGRILVQAAEKAAKPDKDGVLRVKVPVQDEDGTVSLGWLTLDDLRDAVTEYGDSHNEDPSFNVADGRTRSLGVFLLAILGFTVEPAVRIIEPEDCEDEATWAAEKNRHVWNTSKDDRLYNAVARYVPGMKEADFTRDLKVSRGMGQTLHAQSRLIVEGGMAIEDVSRLNAKEARAVWDLGPDGRGAGLEAILAKKDAKTAEKAKPLTPGKVESIAKDANDVLAYVLGLILTGDEASLAKLAKLTSADCIASVTDGAKVAAEKRAAALAAAAQ